MIRLTLTTVLAVALMQPYQLDVAADIYRPWERIGEPCSTETDRREGTCTLRVDTIRKGRRVSNPARTPIRTYWSR